MAALGVLGTGVVGQAIARRAAEVGWEVTVGARTATSESLAVFADDPITTGSFADAVAAAPLVVNATFGTGSLAALGSVGAEALRGKVILDLANELEAGPGPLPVSVAGLNRSLGRQLQEAFPEARVVKSLNTVTNAIMVRPDLIPGDHVAFLSGDDPAAKADVAELLRSFGWRDAQLVDLGGIDTAAAAEMVMPIYLNLMLVRGFTAPPFNLAIPAAAGDAAPGGSRATS